MPGNTTSVVEAAELGSGQGLRPLLGGLRALSARAAQLPRPVATLVALVVLLVHNSIRQPAGFPYDADQYWELGRSFMSGGGFALTHFTGVHRGYSLPLLNAGMIELAGAFGVTEPALFVVSSAIAYALLFTLAWPWMVRALFGYRMNSIQVLAWFALVYTFWREHLLYPLSDFPALFLALTGAASVARFFSGGRVYWLLGAGIAVALASNVRPSYQLLLLPLTVALVIASVRARRRAVTSLGVFMLGMAAAFAPQSYINNHKFDTPSPFVQTTRAYQGQSLFLQQLAWGIYIQRYETSVQRSGSLPRGAVVFVDKAGLDLVRAENVMHPKGTEAAALNPAFTYGDYLRLVFEHPLFFAKAYARHFFNGLDIAYPTVYVTDVRNRSAVFAVVNYVVWLAALGAGLLAIRRGFLRRQWVGAALFVAVCLPSVMSFAGAVETRFFLPLFLGAYLLVVAGALPLLAWLRGERRYVKALILLAAVAWVLAARELSQSTFATLPS